MNLRKVTYEAVAAPTDTRPDAWKIVRTLHYDDASTKTENAGFFGTKERALDALTIGGPTWTTLSDVYTAQIKDRREGAPWRTVKTSDTGWNAAWGELTDEMQRRGLRYSELSAHIADMTNGDTLSAEDGTEFRILSPGQDTDA